MDRRRGRPKIEPPSEEYDNFLRKTLELVHSEAPCPISKIHNQICGGDPNRLEGWFGPSGRFVRERLLRRIEVGRETYVELTPRGELMYKVAQLAPTAQVASDIIHSKPEVEEEEALSMIKRGARLQKLGLHRLHLARRPAKKDNKTPEDD